MIRSRAVVAAAISIALAMIVLPAAVAAQTTALTVADASVAAGSTTLTVPAASLAVDGYIVVHEGDATSFGGVVGSSSLLTAGSHTNVTIQLDRPIENGEYLWPMLHSEDNGNGVYDDPGTDAPIADAGTGNADFGGVVTFPMQLTVESAPAAAPAGNAGLSSDSDGSAPWLAIAAAIVGVSVLLFAGRTFAGRRS